MRNVFACMTLLATGSAMSPALADEASCTQASSSVAVAYMTIGPGHGVDQAALDKILQGCEPGDIITLDNSAWLLGRRVCDFSKSIDVAKDGDTMCVVRKKGAQN